MDHQTIPFGSVTNLYFRPSRNQPLIESRTLTFIAGHGISGDCHLDHLSPRQVLITEYEIYNALNLPANALRENILVNQDLTDLTITSGDTLSTNNPKGVILRLMFNCEPCGRLNKTRPNLCRDVKTQRGWLARVVQGGELSTVDKFYLTKNVYPAFSENWRERVIAIVRLLPSNRSLSYSKLALLAGVASVYCRTFPRLLRTHGLLTEQIVPSSISPAPPLPEWDGQELFADEQLTQD